MDSLYPPGAQPMDPQPDDSHKTPDLPDVIAGMPPGDATFIDSLKKLYRNYHGILGGGFNATIPANDDFSDSYQPEYWILRLLANNCIPLLKLRRSGGDDTYLYLDGPANSANTLTLTGTLGASTGTIGGYDTHPSGPSVFDVDIQSPSPPTNTTHSFTIPDSTTDATDTSETAREIHLEGEQTGGEQACYGPLTRIVLPGSARLFIENPPGQGTLSYSIAAVRGYDPDKVF